MLTNELIKEEEIVDKISVYGLHKQMGKAREHI